MCGCAYLYSFTSDGMLDGEDPLGALADARPLLSLQQVDEVGCEDHVADLAWAVEEDGHLGKTCDAVVLGCDDLIVAEVDDALGRREANQQAKGGRENKIEGCVEGK